MRSEELLKLLEEVRIVITRQRNGTAAEPTQSAAPPQPQEIIDQDLSSYRPQISNLLQEWNTIVRENQPPTNFVIKLQKLCSFEKVISIPILFKLGFDICYSSFHAFLDEPYKLIDNFCHLIVTLVKFSEPESKINLVSPALAILVRTLVKEHENGAAQFHQKPFYRLFSNLLVHLSTNETEGNISVPILISFSNVFTLLVPSKFPGFAFAWLELISHRVFMPKLLLAKSSKGWLLFQGTPTLSIHSEKVHFSV